MKAILIGTHPHFIQLIRRIRQIDDGIDIIWIHPSMNFAIQEQGLPYFASEIIYKEKNLMALTSEILRLTYRVDLRLGHSLVEILDQQKTIRERDNKGLVQEETFDYLFLSNELNHEVPNELKGVSNFVYSFNKLQDVKRFKESVSRNEIKRIIVFGNGKESLVIAENLRELSLRVTILTEKSSLLPFLDSPLSAFVHNYAIDQGISIISNEPIQSVKVISGELHFQLNHKEVITDAVVFVNSTIDSSLKRASSDYSFGGNFIDKPNIFQIDTETTFHYRSGDSLLSLFDNIKKNQFSSHKTNGYKTLIKFYDYEVGSVGETSTSALEKGLSIQTTYTHSRHHDLLYPGSQMMVIQLNINRQTGVLLGAQLVGHLGVDKRLDLFAMAIHAHKTINELISFDPVYDLTLSSDNDAFSQAIQHAYRVFYNELKEINIEEIDLRGLKNLYLIDVREKDMYSDAHIPNAHNIPLMKLRHQLDKIPKTKRIVCYSQTGIQSEIAVDVLRNYGFDAYRLAGDFRLYDTVYMVSECPTCNE